MSKQISSDIGNFVCRGEKWQNKDRSSFSVIELCFVINELNNKTIILLSIAEFPLFLANSAANYQVKFSVFWQYNY